MPATPREVVDSFIVLLPPDIDGDAVITPCRFSPLFTLITLRVFTPRRLIYAIITPLLPTATLRAILRFAILLMILLLHYVSLSSLVTRFERHFSARRLLLRQYFDAIVADGAHVIMIAAITFRLRFSPLLILPLRHVTSRRRYRLRRHHCQFHYAEGVFMPIR